MQVMSRSGGFGEDGLIGHLQLSQGYNRVQSF